MPDPVTVGSLAVAALGGGVAISKLLDVVRSGVGAVARPWLMVQEAHAKVKVDKILADGAIELEASKRGALPPAPELQLGPLQMTERAHAGEIVIDVDFEDVPPLAQRTEERLTYQEEKRQLNVERVIREAVEELHGVKDVSEQPVDDDWTARFFGSVQDVSNEQIRKIWAKILAGEVVTPGSFSLRTLDVLKNLGSKEAELFTEVAKLSTMSGAILDFGKGKAFHDINRSIALADAGLISTARTAHTALGMVYTADDNVAFRDVLIAFVHPTKPETKVNFGAISLTTMGRELARVVAQESDREHVREVLAHIRSKGFTATLHRIKSVNEIGPVIDATPIE